MIFRFRNLGPIEDASLELGGLTIIAGRNNTGKTYLAYTLCGLLQERALWSGRGGVSEKLATLPDELRSPEAEPLDFEQIAESLSTVGYAIRRVDRAMLSQERALLARNIDADDSRSCVRRVLRAGSRGFADARLSVEWEDAFPASVPPVTVRAGGAGTVSVEFDGARAAFRADLSNGRPQTHYRNGAEAAYFHLLLSSLPVPVVLTAERFGISLFFRELDFAKNRLLQSLQQVDYRNGENGDDAFRLIERATSRYATPIQDNIDFTRSLPDLQNDVSELRERRLSDRIEDLMDGTFRISDGEVRFVSRRREEGRFDIPLSQASSSARGLADLYFYLRHAARREHLLIVDEPESHLDTENQVQLVHLLTGIVKAGMRVLITTHSDYIAKEINNLLMLGHLESKKDALRTFGYREDLALEDDQVRAYVAEDGGLRPCDRNAYGLDLPVFERTIESINRRAQGISSRLMQQEDPGA